jgi:hypothetical protein
MPATRTASGETVARVFTRYNAMLEHNHALDFTTCWSTVQLFRDYPRSWGSIGADSGIDGRRISGHEHRAHEIVKLITRKATCALSATGSIDLLVAFGRHPQHLNFEDDFPDLKLSSWTELPLDQHDLKVARAVIATTRPQREPLDQQRRACRYRAGRTEQDEALYDTEIGSCIKRAARALDRSDSLNRTNAVARHGRTFIQAGMPYRLVGGIVLRRKNVLAYCG